MVDTFGEPDETWFRSPPAAGILIQVGNGSNAFPKRPITAIPGVSVIEKKRIEITLETKQVLVIRSPQASGPARCAECGGTRMVAPEDIAMVNAFSTRAIYRLIEDGWLHFVETRDGSLLICLNSLVEQWAQTSGLKAKDH